MRWDVLAPGSADARYEELSSGHSNRVELYLARRHLGFLPEEWEALPWWQRQMYMDGLEEEKLISTVPQEESWEDNPLSAPSEEYSRMGLTVIDGGKL